MSNFSKYFIGLVTLSLFFVLISNVSSADLKAPALKIAPLKYDEKIKIGEAKDGIIDIQNPTADNLSLAVEVNSLKTKSKSTSLEFYHDKSKNSFESFVTLEEKQFLLPANTGRKFKFRLGIPVNIKPGGYYGTIFFRILPGSNDQNSSAAIISGRIGTLFLLEIGEGGERNGIFEDFQNKGGLFSYNENFLIKAVNNGTYGPDNRGLPLKPVGKLEIADIFGRKVFEQKIDNIYVLPETEKVISTEYKSPLVLGVYKAKLSLAKYPGEPIEVREKTFFKISPTVIFMIFFLSAAIFIVSFYFKRRRSAKN